MGCASTRVAERHDSGIEKNWKNLKHLDTTTSTIWVDETRDVVIKRKKRTRPKEMKHTIDNNCRVKNIPRCIERSLKAESGKTREEEG